MIGRVLPFASSSSRMVSRATLGSHGQSHPRLFQGLVASRPQRSSLSPTTTDTTIGIRRMSTTNDDEDDLIITLPNFSSVSADPESYYKSSETTFSSSPKDRWTPQLTKIVATIGPTSEQLEVLQPLVSSGMRIMRLNFSHATREEVELRTTNLKACRGRHSSSLPNHLVDDSDGSLNLRATLLDTKGPEIRAGKLANDVTGKDTVRLEQGSTIILHTSEDTLPERGSTEKDLFVDYANLTSCGFVDNQKILLDDGAVSLTVRSVDPAEGKVTCTIDNSGDLRSRAGVNLPGVETDLPALTEKDKIDIEYGLTKDVDYIAASFVQSAKGVREIRDFVDSAMKKLGLEGPPPLIISKVESVSALVNFDSILEESDGIMVARGDLGVEIPIQQVVNAQKEMTRKCNEVGKPCIVATQMLESMAKNPRPTRAEVADVTNAVYDGADAVMTSGETAKGYYPVETIRMMNEILLGAERFARAKPELTGSFRPDFSDEGSVAVVAGAAVTTADRIQASAILIYGVDEEHHRLRLAQHVSAARPDVPIVVRCRNAKTARQLMVYRGVHPMLAPPSLSDESKTKALEDAMRMNFIRGGDDVVVLSVGTEGSPVLKIVTVPRR